MNNLPQSNTLWLPTPTATFPADHPLWKSGIASGYYEARDSAGAPILTVLVERAGHDVVVRRPIGSEQGGRIEVFPGDSLYVVTTITGVSLNTSEEVGDTKGLLTSAFIRQVGREGNIVFAETVPPDEAPPSRPVYLGQGDQLSFRAGSVTVSFASIDAARGSDKGDYRPVANSIWTWLHFAQSSAVDPKSAKKLVYLTTIAQKLDEANELFHRFDELRRHLPVQNTGPELRETVFGIVSKAHSFVVVLSRAIAMLEDPERLLSLQQSLPPGLTIHQGNLKQIRNAIEHAEEHAFCEPESDSPFNWHTLVSTGSISRKGRAFDISEDTKKVLLDARAYLVQIVDAHVSTK